MKKMKMGHLSRGWFALAALLLLPLYQLPFWSISMSAPQYPGGIGMHISINDVEGHARHDLQSINTLNHYIGMKEIVKEEFREFDIMPWVMALMVILGIAGAMQGDKRWVWIWLGLMLLIGIVGFVDYYLWGYDYGHNLNPDAPIKVPGMSYQPPLIGCKQLLNINACSWPYLGSIFLGLSVGFAGMVAWRERGR